jgi:hypothetical protein
MNDIVAIEEHLTSACLSLFLGINLSAALTGLPHCA